MKKILRRLLLSIETHKRSMRPVAETTSGTGMGDCSKDELINFLTARVEALELTLKEYERI